MSLNNYCKLKNIHFIGIGGIGMSAIAEVMFHSGYIISGSDQASNSITTKLSSIGITVNIGHAASHVSGADIVVVSSAIGQDNIEFSTAKSMQIPIFSRAEMLAELMRSKFSIAIAGTHGKTTTSSLIAHIFKQAKLKPGYIIGGILGNTNTNAEYGDSDFLITEADESDGSFTLLKPMLAAITNIDNDHMEAYSHSEDSLQQSFLQFIHNLPFYGSIVICGDDPGINSIRDKIYRPIVSYGLQSGNMITASDIKHSGTSSNFTVSIKGSDTFAVQLNMPGKHNIFNTLAAIAIADICQIPHDVIAQAIQSFSGVGRR